MPKSREIKCVWRRMSECAKSVCVNQGDIKFERDSGARIRLSGASDS